MKKITIEIENEKNLRDRLMLMAEDIENGICYKKEEQCNWKVQEVGKITPPEIEIRFIKSGANPKIDNTYTAAEVIRSIEDIKKNMTSKEMMYALYLDKAGRVMNALKLGEGTEKNVTVNVCEMIMGAYLNKCTDFIITHNHPSGKTRPSKEDLAMTELAKNSAQTVGMKLIDHIIIAEDEYYSFCEEGML